MVPFSSLLFAVMTGTVYDFSFAHAGLRPQQFVDVGAAGIVGYIGGDSRKCLTRPEVVGYLAAGLSVTTVHEITASWRSWDGAAANRGADALRQPDDRPIFYAADTDIALGDYPAVSDFLAAQPGRPKGIYGESGLVEFCLEAGSAIRGWIASASAWSHDPAPKAHLRQLVGQTTIPGTDKNVVLQNDWGQWPLDASGGDSKVAEMTMVYPPDVYEATMLDGTTPNPSAGQRHPYAGYIFVVSGLTATHVSSPAMLGLYRYLGVGGPVAIHSEWFANLALLPNGADPSHHTFPVPTSGGGGSSGPVDLAALGKAASDGVLAGLVAHPLAPKA